MKKTRFSSGTVCLIGYLVVLSISSVNLVSADYGKLFERCTTEKNTFDCLKRRALEVLNTAIKDDSVYVINDFVSVAKDPASSVASKEQQQSSNDTDVKSLDEQLAKKFQDYLASRSIKLTIPGDAIQGGRLSKNTSKTQNCVISVGHSDYGQNEDARRRKKDKGGYGGALMVGGLAVAGVMAQLAYGKIAFIAGTALLTAKIALVLSAIIGLKKLVSSGGGGHEVIYATASEHHGGYGGGYGGWQRSLSPMTPT